MKIEIELSEEEAACLWDDVTWAGKYPKPIAEIVQTYVSGRAAVAVAQLAEDYRPVIIRKFHLLHPDPVQSPPDTRPEDKP